MKVLGTECEHAFNTGHRGLNNAQFRTGARAPSVNDTLVHSLSYRKSLWLARVAIVNAMGNNFSFNTCD